MGADAVPHVITRAEFFVLFLLFPLPLSIIDCFKRPLAGGGLVGEVAESEPLPVLVGTLFAGIEHDFGSPAVGDTVLDQGVDVDLVVLRERLVHGLKNTSLGWDYEPIFGYSDIPSLITGPSVVTLATAATTGVLASPRVLDLGLGTTLATGPSVVT